MAIFLCHAFVVSPRVFTEGFEDDLQSSVNWGRLQPFRQGHPEEKSRVIEEEE